MASCFGSVPARQVGALAYQFDDRRWLIHDVRSFSKNEKADPGFSGMRYWLFCRRVRGTRLIAIEFRRFDWFVRRTWGCVGLVCGFKFQVP